MPIFEILDDAGDTINRIVAHESHVADTYEHYRRVEPSTQQVEGDARDRRDDELAGSDWIVPVTDHPDHADWLDFRQRLRDWPATDEFPADFPVLHPEPDEPPDAA